MVSASTVTPLGGSCCVSPDALGSRKDINIARASSVPAGLGSRR
jgi:hypothetical protein